MGEGKTHSVEYQLINIEEIIDNLRWLLKLVGESLIRKKMFK